MSSPPRERVARVVSELDKVKEKRQKPRARAKPSIRRVCPTPRAHQVRSELAESDIGPDDSEDKQSDQGSVDDPPGRPWCLGPSVDAAVSVDPPPTGPAVIADPPAVLRARGKNEVRASIGCGYILLNESNEGLDGHCDDCGAVVKRCHRPFPRAKMRNFGTKSPFGHFA